jgi:hypothetical protein
MLAGGGAMGSSGGGLPVGGATTAVRRGDGGAGRIERGNGRWRGKEKTERGWNFCRGQK